MFRSKRNNFTANVVTQQAMATLSTAQPQQTDDTETDKTYSSSQSRSSSSSSSPRRRSCTYGFSGCRGGRRCSRQGHATEAAAVKMLIQSMTLMMRSQLEMQDGEKGLQGGKRDEKGVREESEDEKQPGSQGPELPSYQDAVRGR